MSKKFPKPKITIIELMDQFQDENYCKDYFLELRAKNGLVCEKCGNDTFYKIKTRHICRCKKCRREYSPTNGTFMHGTHIKLRLWIIAAYLFMDDKRGCSAVYLMSKLGVTYKTAWYILHRFRKAMKNRDERYLLDNIVELDDTYLGAPTHGKKRGRGTEKTKIMVAVSKTDDGKPRYIKMVDVPNLKGTTVGKFAKANIKPGSKIESDNAASYKKPLAEKYFHEFETYDPEDGRLHWLHTIISNFKALINGTYYGNEKIHSGLYCAEYSYRFNRRNFHENAFINLLSASLDFQLVLGVRKG